MWAKLTFLILICDSVIPGNAQEVEIPQGKLKGDTRTNRDGGVFYAFKNIPYAKPPVGKLRFKAPEPADGWEGVRDATKEIPSCPQLFSDVGEEDCLYLNVYTPALPAQNVTQKAVMINLFAGAHIAGTAAETSYGAALLLTKDVVVVTINNRVTMLGFLTLDDPNLGVTGNAGLKDQVLALQWVQNNIKYFGGDPNNVLIIGNSAGARSIHLHILSPMSRGLFHKAILQSGNSLSPIVTFNTRNTGVMIAEQLGIPTENWEVMLTALQEVSVNDLREAELALSPSLPIFSYISKPVVEISSSESTFLEQNPIDIIKSGNYNHVPCIHGHNDAEGLMLLGFLNDDTGEAPLIPSLTDYIPSDLLIKSESDAEKDIIQRYRDFYYNGGESNRTNITRDVRFFTDYAYTYPYYRTTMEQLKTALYPIYYYYFTGDTKLNIAKLRNEEAASHPGSTHGDEILYIWDAQRRPDIQNGTVEDLVSKNMVELWTNFAIYGNPTPGDFDYIWKPVQKDQFNYLHIGNEGSYASLNLLNESIQFWLSIYQDYYNTN
uniref:Carboxylic ester hydrolase n=1 Tax=Holotrichia parallela TaxID=93412 RepID=A0A6G7SKB1_HOLPA|nr:carboxylesterase 12 [Holotrichia parallela]